MSSTPGQGSPNAPRDGSAATPIVTTTVSGNGAAALKPDPLLDYGSAAGRAPQRRRGGGMQPFGQQRHRRTTLPRTTKGWSRAIVWSLVGLSGFSIVFGLVGRIDSTITANGKLRPRTGVVKINSPINTRVARVLVKEGETVRAGQPLLLFEQEGLAEQERQLESLQQLWQKEVQLYARQLGLPNVLPGGNPNNRELAIEEQEVQIRERIADSEQQKSRIGLRQQISDLEALRRKYEINQSITQRMERLLAQGAISELEVDRQQERQADLLGTLNRTAKEVDAARQRIEESRLRRDQVPTANLKQLYTQYDSARQQLAEITSRLMDVRERIRLGRLLAPRAGVVFDLSVKAGEVPTDDRVLMQIVPQSGLEAELSISNQDIGHLKTGETVDVRINSFPFTEYGSVKGKLTRISADAKPADPQNPQDFFTAIVVLNSSQLTKDQKTYQLKPGMAVQGLINTGTRPAISLITDRFNSFLESGKSIR